MRLIIQKQDGHLFIYREDEKHYKAVKHCRPKPLKKKEFFKLIDHECWTRYWPDEDFTFQVKL